MSTSAGPRIPKAGGGSRTLPHVAGVILGCRQAERALGVQPVYSPELGPRPTRQGYLLSW